MKPVDALRIVQGLFPFPHYMDDRDGEYLGVADTVLRHLQPPARILDFGSGPCDKTAILQKLGYECFACDDLQDDWHLQGNHRDEIVTFAREMGIDLRLVVSNEIPFKNELFDMIMLNAVVEHLHDSPRSLLNALVALLRPGGLLLIMVPNAVNIRKRIAVLRGKTNLPPFDSYYWYPGPWRGHVREYVKGDLESLAEYLCLSVRELRSCHQMIYRIPRIARPIYKAVTSVFTGWRDSWIFVGEKPHDWAPKEPPRKEPQGVR